MKGVRMVNQEVIPIFFTVDNSYAPYLDCAVRSMAENASGEYRYRIYVLYQGMTEENMKRIEMGVKAPFEITFVEMQDELKTITDRAENRLRCDYFTLTIYFRLFIAEMFPEYDKGIYLDSDIVVPGDISEMYRMELGDNLIAACQDHSVVDVPELVYYIEHAVGVSKTEYVNSGVLLMNLKKMREVSFSSKFLSLLNEYHFDCLAPDQDYINAMCNGKILYLDECWDAMPPEGGERGMIENPKLIHYNLFQKPWCYDSIPYEKYFWKYASGSPFYQEIMDFKANYSDEQKRSDKQCLKTMIEKGCVVDKQEITFRKIQESRKTVRI